MRASLAACIAGAMLARTVAAQPTSANATIRRPLTADTTINGIPCARSGKAPAEFHPGNRLAGCALSRSLQIGAHFFPADTWLDFNATGVLWGAWLPSDTPLGGLTCHGVGFKGWRVRFHPNGRLAGCYLASDTVIAGVPCMSGSFFRELRGGGHTGIGLDETGKVRRCQAARDTTANGVTIRKWDVVAWDSAGRVVRR